MTHIIISLNVFLINSWQLRVSQSITLLYFDEQVSHLFKEKMKIGNMAGGGGFTVSWLLFLWPAGGLEAAAGRSSSSAPGRSCWSPESPGCGWLGRRSVGPGAPSRSAQQRAPVGKATTRVKHPSIHLQECVDPANSLWICLHVCASSGSRTWKHLFQIPERVPTMGPVPCPKEAPSWT